MSEDPTTVRAALRLVDPTMCWAVLNNGFRACIQKKGHDEGVHEGPRRLACADDTPHNEHPWIEKLWCNGRDETGRYIDGRE